MKSTVNKITKYKPLWKELHKIIVKNEEKLLILEKLLYVLQSIISSLESEIEKG